ncbi:hypothetical protein AAFC00_001747 [Neodothiora populina]|uniref:FAS1 domain-containing protein n=1 Tax=Neodothiora populina TaxID=2781224 RepID=A0ABR3PQ01_9PEZI
MGGSDSTLTIGDVIGLERSVNIFAGLTRDINAVSDRLDSASDNTTVLAPLDSAITKLSTKPWEDASDYSALGESAYEGKSGEDRAQRNLRRFVEAHIVHESPWTEKHKIQTLGGNTIWWERKEGKTYIYPGAIEVTSQSKKAGNGEIWVVDGVVNAA